MHYNRQYLAIKATVLFHRTFFNTYDWKDIRWYSGHAIGAQSTVCLIWRSEEKPRQCQKCRPNFFSNSVVRQHDRSNEIDVAWRDLNHLENPPSLKGHVFYYFVTFSSHLDDCRWRRFAAICRDRTTKIKRWNIHVICRVSFYPAYYCGRTEIIMRLSDKERVAASSAESRTKKRSLELLPNEICIDRG